MKFLASAVVILVAFCSQLPVFAQTIKLGTVAPDGSPWHRIARDMGDAWSKATTGKIQVRVYPGGVAGDDPDMIRKMRVGQLHAAMLTSVGLAQVVPDVQSLQTPLLLTNDQELDYVKERITPKLELLFEAQGFTVLNWGEAGWVYFFTQKPVIRPEDLKSQKLFVWSGDDTAFRDAWKEAGYSPVPIPVTEILTGLQSGLVNAFVAPPIAALSFQWFALAKNMTDLKWVSLVGATVISSKVWREIPQETQRTLLGSAREISLRYKPEVRRLNETSIGIMKKHGLAVHAVPPDQLARWEATARASYPRLIGKVVSAQMANEVERLRNEYRLSQTSR